MQSAGWSPSRDADAKDGKMYSASRDVPTGAGSLAVLSCIVDTHQYVQSSSLDQLSRKYPSLASRLEQFLVVK